MAISRGRELVAQLNPDPNEVRKAIKALETDAEHVRKCIKANLRDYDSGQAAIDEIRNLINELEKKL